MKLKVLGSSSKGNCYIIGNKQSILILEAGIPLKDVLPAIKFDISKIVGVLSSHIHGDHSKCIPDYLFRSIPVYAPEETAGVYKTKIVRHKKVFQVGNFKIMPFELKHDAQCLGFLIQHPEMGKLLFCTDTYYIPYKFQGLNHILVEVNYSKNIINDNVLRGVTPFIHYKRALSSHMELETTKEMLRANDLSTVVNIVLLHLSDKNSDSVLFKKEIESVTGRPVYIADKELEISLNKEGF
jgi:phosphoribosyl 1,2-cyclic phosphodiesterase